MDVRRDGDVASRRVAGAERPAGPEPRPTGAAAEPRTRDAYARGPAPRHAPPPSPDPAQPPSSEPAKAAGWFIAGVIVITLALLALPWFIFSVVVAAPLALIVLGIAAALLAARRSRSRRINR